MTVYDQLAVYYDLVHQDVADDLLLLLGLAEQRGDPILELGCGTGRTLLPLVRAGYQVVGLDNSAAMLKVCQRRLAEDMPAASGTGEATLYQGDMISFDLPQRFPLITVPFHTWMHLTQEEDQLAALGCINAHLAPGGWLFIDLPAPDTITGAEHDGALTLERMLRDPDTGERILQFASTRLEEAQQILQVTWIYDRIGEDGVVRRLVLPMDLRYLYPQEAEHLLNRAGLQLVALWGNYQMGGYSARSEKILILAEKLPN